MVWKFDRFAVDSALNGMKLLEVFKSQIQPKLPGAAHGDELCYLFRYLNPQFMKFNCN